MKNEEWNIKGDEVDRLLVDDDENEEEEGLVIVNPGSQKGEKKALLSRHQIIMTAIVASVSFLFFLVVLFPYGQLVTHIVLKLASPAVIQFTTFEPSLFGPSAATGLNVTLPDKTGIEAEEAYVSVGKIPLVLSNAVGNAYIREFTYQSRDMSLSGRMLDASFDIQNAMGPIGNWFGTFTINGSAIEPSKLPLRGFQLPLGPEEMVISRLIVSGEVDQGSFDLSGSILETPLFKVKIFDGGKAQTTFDSLRLNGRICIETVKDLETKNNAVYSLYRMTAGDRTGDLCFKVGGTPGSPSFNMME